MDSSQPVQIYLLIMSEVARSNVLRRSLGEIEAAWERGDFATIVLGERVVAAAAILEFSHCIKIGSVVVCEDCRGRGYGRAPAGARW